MIALLQRVLSAKVSIDEKTHSQIKQGLLVFLAIEKEDHIKNNEKIIHKILNFRIFADHENKMNLNIQQIEGEILVVSQFTLAANTQKGNKPSFDSAKAPQEAKMIYDDFISQIKQKYPKIQTGVFGADMQIHLINDGPVTFTLNS